MFLAVVRVAVDRAAVDRFHCSFRTSECPCVCGVVVLLYYGRNLSLRVNCGPGANCCPGSVRIVES
eukprot:6410446-Prymnesium_polylepis.1